MGTGGILVPLNSLNGSTLEYPVYALIGAVLVIVMHRDNMGRLVSGTERRIGEKVVAGDSPGSAYHWGQGSQEPPAGVRR